MNQIPSLEQLTRTKTVATVGPACATIDILTELIREGVDVFRINMAHGSREDHQTAVDRIRQASAEAEIHAAILIDLAGPKIRLGELHTDPIRVEPDSKIWFVRGEVSSFTMELTCNYAGLVDEVKVGNEIILCDGLVRLEVISNDGDKVECRVVDGGEIRSRRGVNLPGVDLKVSALGEVDIDNAKWAAANQIDFVSLSFVRNEQEIQQLKQLLKSENSDAFVVAKIEKAEALDALDSIISATDAVMVARGDLGVEIRIEKTPLAQKRIIAKCQELGKPVIVATQMLESMHHNKQPTRAEVSDVANAILDGADACMLSGETAVGDHPVHVVKLMQRIMRETENELQDSPSRELSGKLDEGSISNAVVFGAAQIAKKINAACVTIATPSGQAALTKSKQRDFIPTFAITNRLAVARRMNLFWGIVPVYHEHLNSPKEITDYFSKCVCQEQANANVINPGDELVMVVDSEFWPGVHETITVGKIVNA